MSADEVGYAEAQSKTREEPPRHRTRERRRHSGLRRRAQQQHQERMARSVTAFALDRQEVPEGLLVAGPGQPHVAMLQEHQSGFRKK
jgi:hypothetical protein